jgi:hypothetical protein
VCRDWEVVAYLSSLGQGDDGGRDMGAGLYLAWAVAIPFFVAGVEDHGGRNGKSGCLYPQNYLFIRARLAGNTVGSS